MHTERSAELEALTERWTAAQQQLDHEERTRAQSMSCPIPWTRQKHAKLRTYAGFGMVVNRYKRI